MNQNTYSRQTAQLIATLAQNVPELNNEAMQYWIGNPQELQSELKNLFLPTWKTWKTIKIGQRKSPDAMISALKECVNITNGQVAFWDRLDEEGMSQEIQEVELILVDTASEPFFHMNGKRISQRFQAQGFECLSAEMAGELAIAGVEENVRKVGLETFSRTFHCPDKRQIAYRFTDGWAPGYSEPRLNFYSCISVDNCAGDFVVFAKPRK